MIFQSYLAILLIATIIFFIVFLLKKKFSKDVLMKMLSLLLVVVFIFRSNIMEEAISAIRGLNIPPPGGSLLFTGPTGPLMTLITAILIWFTYAIVYILMLQPFYKRKTPRNIIKTFGVLVLLLDMVFLKQYIVGIVGKEVLNTTNIFSAISLSPTLLFVLLEFGVLIAIIASDYIEKKYLDVNLKDIALMILVFLGILVVSMPVYTLKVIKGYAPEDIVLMDLNVYHRIVIYAFVILAYLFYRVFKNKDEDTVRYAFAIISVAAMFVFSFRITFEDLKDISNWPLHLCNTAMYILPLCFLFKMDKLFYFTIFINVFGAFIAMAMPNYTWDNLFASETVRFWQNHIIACVLPILAIFLRLYKRPNFKFFVYSVYAFTAYFVLVLVINAGVTNYNPDVNFFFINNDFVAAKLGIWAENLRDFTWDFNIGELNFKFYPLYQFLFYLTYVGIAAAIWFLYEQFFIIQDTGEMIAARRERRKMERLVLKEALNGRSFSEPMNENGKDCFELIGFSKCYGLSKKFAVKNVHLKVNGGEIFGFLGPNGAGKSTIIKSIVGIQSITEGRIEICGYDVEKQSSEAKSQIGFVPDHYALYENLTGREYINYMADIYKVSKKDRDERIAYYVDLFQLAESFDNKMKTYSHGMKQKMTIIAALIHNPKVWILDEPLTGLDPTSIFQVKECMKKHAEAGNVVFFSSHIIDVVEKLCTRIAIIKKGNILCNVTTAELKEKNIDLEQFYLEHIGDDKIVKGN